MLFGLTCLHRLANYGICCYFPFFFCIQGFPWIEADNELTSLPDAKMIPLKTMSSHLIKVRAVQVMFLSYLVTEQLATGFYSLRVFLLMQKEHTLYTLFASGETCYLIGKKKANC